MPAPVKPVPHKNKPAAPEVNLRGGYLPTDHIVQYFDRELVREYVNPNTSCIDCLHCTGMVVDRQARTRDGMDVSGRYVSAVVIGYDTRIERSCAMRHNTTRDERCLDWNPIPRQP